MAGAQKRDDPKFKSMTLKIEVFIEFEKLKEAEEQILGLQDLSWSDYIGILVKRLNGKARKTVDGDP